MNRRDLLAAAAAISMSPLARARAAEGDLRGAMREAFIYGLPLIEMAQARARMLNPAAGAQGAALNAFRHSRALSGAKDRAITTPNNDTLYSSAWLDLTRGPVTLVIPPTGNRYISVAAMNMFTDNDAVLGTRTTGGQGGRYTLVGPGQPGLGPHTVRIATPHAWLLARVLVDGPEDLAATYKVQDGLQLTGPTVVAPSDTYASRRSPPLEFLASVGRLLQSDPPPATDGALFQRVAALGLRPHDGFAPANLDAAALKALSAGVVDAIPIIRGGAAGVAADGWNYLPGDIGLFGQDYAFRAAVALGGLGALPPVEAMYVNPVGDRGRMFTGPGPYRLSFPAGRLPPVDAFWSLTMYEGTPDGQFFLTENPIARYSIGDRTPGLRRNPDGSLDLWLARGDPGGERTANWLPAPATGAFTVTMRAYLPRPELLDGRYRLPPILSA